MLRALQPSIIPSVFRIFVKFNMDNILKNRAWVWLFAILNTSCVYPFTSCSYAVFLDNHHEEGTVVPVHAMEV